MRTHDEIQDLLEGYVDETLDRETYRDVTGHLAGCDECRAILDEVAPVDLSGLAASAFDERVLRHSVRRAMRRTVFDAVLVIVAAVLAFWLIGHLVFQPLIINRGDRAAAAARATYDLALMLNEGGVVTDFTIESEAFDRTFTVELALPVGSGNADLGSVSSRVGVLAFGDEHGGRLFPYAGSGGGGDALTQLKRLGSGTVATVAIRFDQPLSTGRAQELADQTARDVRVVWAGFRIDDSVDTFDGPFGPGSVVGYPTCLGPQGFDEDLFRATSASAGGSSTLFAPSSVAAALSEVRRAVTNLVDHPEIGEAMPDRQTATPELLEAASQHLSQPDPGVASLVITGPTDEVLGFVNDVAPAWTSLLGVDFYNWSFPICGR